MTSCRGCVLVVCGLPGSGKSSLVKQLKTGLTVEFRIVVVEYDLLMPTDVEKTLIAQTPAEDTSKWKLYREQIVVCVDLMLEHLCGSSFTSCPAFSKPTSVSDELWLMFLEHCVPSLQNRDPKQDSQPSGQSKDPKQAPIDPEQAPQPFVIIIDDNMYYRSMRYQYYQLARKYTVGFCELYLDCSVERAVSQNAKRTSGQVDPGVIGSMAVRFEPPNSTACQWEELCLKTSSLTTSSSDITTLIHRAVDTPVSPFLEGDDGAREESREACSSSVVHQADQILRRLVARAMSEAKRSGDPTNELQLLAGRLAERRQRILTDMRAGLVDPCLTGDPKDASKDPNSDLYHFIESLFCSDYS